MAGGLGAAQYRTNVHTEDLPKTTKQIRGVWRLNGMHAPIQLDRPLRPVARTAFRTAFSLVVALLLIFVLLPAILAVQAAAI